MEVEADEPITINSVKFYLNRRNESIAIPRSCDVENSDSDYSNVSDHHYTDGLHEHLCYVEYDND